MSIVVHIQGPKYLLGPWICTRLSVKINDLLLRKSSEKHAIESIVH